MVNFADLVCSEMGKNSEILLEQRAIIKYLTRKGLSGKRIHAALEEAFQANAMQLRTVQEWRKRFAEGRQRISVETHRRTTRTACTQENIERVRLAVESDTRRTVRKLS